MTPSKPTILIVDDTPDAILTLVTLLEPLGYQISTALSGSEALLKIRTILPDLVLLDLMLPDMHGFDVCRTIRQIAHCAEIPILFVTSINDRQVRIAGLQAGADDFLTKPIDPTELIARVQTITRLNRYRLLYTIREQLSWVVDHAQEGFVILNMAGYATYANPQARRYLGWPTAPQELPQEPFLTAAGRQYHCEPEALWKHWPAPSQQPRFLVLPQTHGVSAFWLQIDVFATPATDGSRLVRLSDVTMQITSRRDMHSFQNMVMHKLRTPLQGMGIALDLIDQTLPPDNNRSHIQMAMEVVQQSRSRLEEAIDDVLQYSQIDLINQSDRYTNLSNLIEQFTNISIHLSINTGHLRYETDLESVSFQIAPRALEIVLWELCENSKKFHPNQTPTIDIQLKWYDQSQIQLIFQDDGATLAPHQIIRALRPYDQAEPIFTGEVAGMGLGLATVSAIIWGVGGKCQIANRPDRPGVEVLLTIPVSGQR